MAPTGKEYRVTRALNCVDISIIRMSSGGWLGKRRKRSEKHGTMSACFSMCWRKSGKKIRHTALSRWIFSGDKTRDCRPTRLKRIMMPIEVIESHSILPDLVRRGGVVLDCGANLGAFSMEMIRRFDCRCYAFEASPVVFKPYARAFKSNRTKCSDLRRRSYVALELSEDITRNKIGMKE